jgi:hypothetical protein
VGETTACHQSIICNINHSPPLSNCTAQIPEDGKTMGSNYELWSTSSQRTDSGNIHRLLTAESKQNSICDDTARTGLQRFVKNCVPMHNTHKRGSSPPVSEPINWVYSLAYIYIYIYIYFVTGTTSTSYQPRIHFFQYKRRTSTEKGVRHPPYM